MKRLSEPTGAVSNEAQPGDSETQVVRPAVLVHAGPENSAITFMSGDGEISFDANRIKRICEIHNARMQKLASEYGGADKIPMGAYEPILDSHENDSNDKVIGRLTGMLHFEVRDLPKVGKNVPCAVAKPGITFLGKDTVERVNDGRIYHLSIGINEEDDTLGETSTVVKPAAPGAALLKLGTITNNKGEPNMDLKKLKAAQTARLARLSSIKEIGGGITTRLTATSAKTTQLKRAGELTHRLKGLCAAGKMTPAEYRTLLADEGHFKRLTAMSDDDLKTSLYAFESRQKSVIEPGQRGSTAAAEFFGDVSKHMADNKGKSSVKRLRAEIAGDWKKLSGKKMIDGEDAPEDKEKDLASEIEKDKKELSGPQEAPVAPGADPHAVPGQAGDEQQLAAHMAALGKHLASGDLESAKKVHASLAAHMSKGMKHMAGEDELSGGDVKSEDYKKGMDSLQMELDEVKTQMARMAGMVEEMIGAEKQEGEHYGEGNEQPAPVAK